MRKQGVNDAACRRDRRPAPRAEGRSRPDAIKRVLQAALNPSESRHAVMTSLAVVLPTEHIPAYSPPARPQAIRAACLTPANAFKSLLGCHRLGNLQCKRQMTPRCESASARAQARLIEVVARDARAQEGDGVLLQR